MASARISPLILYLSLLCSAPALAAECSGQSGPQRVALLELYTSEGCSSCPPADRWLNSLEKRSFTSDKIIPIALHVDYWDYIGWKDRYASPTFSARQREQATLNRSNFVYTPQALLNGKDYRGWGNDSKFGDDISTINRSPAHADIRLTINTAQDRMKIKAVAHSPAKSVLYIALVENNLSSEVKAGENSGSKLNHDHVVRTWLGPVEVEEAGLDVQRSFTLNPDWNAKNMKAVAFVQNSSSGEVLQAIALKLCL
jgi:hypothetical protein